MVIRKMTEADLPQVYAIEQETFSDPWSEDDFLNSIKDKNNNYLIVEIEGKVAAYCGYWGVVGEGDIFNVAVKEDFRGQHIGTTMLQTLICEAISRGITALTLEVRVSNQAAIHLYKSLGFETAGIRKDFYTKPKEDAVIMWLNPIQ